MKDPIVEEVRKAGEELAKRANYDLHTFLETLRNNEKKSNAKVRKLPQVISKKQTNLPE